MNMLATIGLAAVMMAMFRIGGLAMWAVTIDGCVNALTSAYLCTQCGDCSPRIDADTIKVQAADKERRSAKELVMWTLLGVAGFASAIAGIWTAA